MDILYIYIHIFIYTYIYIYSDIYIDRYRYRYMHTCPFLCTHPPTHLPIFNPLPIYCGPRQVALAAAPGPCLKFTSISASLPWRPAPALPQCACCAGAANRDNARKGTRGARERAACVCARVWERVRDCGRTPQLGSVVVEQRAAAIIHRYKPYDTGIAANEGLHLLD
jgi:hypothetical protein